MGIFSGRNLVQVGLSVLQERAQRNLNRVRPCVILAEKSLSGNCCIRFLPGPKRREVPLDIREGLIIIRITFTSDDLARLTGRS